MGGTGTIPQLESMHHPLFQITDKIEPTASSSSCLLDFLAVMDFFFELCVSHNNLFCPQAAVVRMLLSQ